MRLKALCLAAVLSLCAFAHGQITIGNGGTITITAGSGGGLTGNATSIQSQPISATTPTDGQVLTFDLTNGMWTPKTLVLPGVGSCTSGLYLTSIVTGSAPVCAQIQYSQIAGTPINTVIYSGTPISGQFAQFVSANTVQPVASTGTGNVVLATAPIIQNSLTVLGGNPGIANNGANWTAGAGAPSGTCAPGSIYSNTAATNSSTALYLCFGSWSAITLSGSGSSAHEIVGNLAEYDFDGSDTGPTLTTTGSPSVISTNTFTAPGAADFTAAGSFYTSTFTTASATVYARAEVRANTETTGSERLFAIYNGTHELGTVFFSASTGYLTIWNDATASGTACATSGISSGTYHLIEFEWTASATAGSFAAKIDGATTCNVTGVNTGTFTVGAIEFGQVAASAAPWDVELDNVGFSSTNWLGGVTP